MSRWQQTRARLLDPFFIFSQWKEGSRSVGQAGTAWSSSSSVRQPPYPRLSFFPWSRMLDLWRCPQGPSRLLLVLDFHNSSLLCALPVAVLPPLRSPSIVSWLFFESLNLWDSDYTMNLVGWPNPSPWLMQGWAGLGFHGLFVKVGLAQPSLYNLNPRGLRPGQPILTGLPLLYPM